MSHEDIKALSETYISMINEARGEKMTWQVPGRSKRDFDSKAEEIMDILYNFGVDVIDFGVDRKGKATLVVQSIRDVETVENELSFEDDLVKDGEIELDEGTKAKKGEQLDEAARTAKQIAKRADTLSKNINDFEKMLKSSKPKGAGRDYDKAVDEMRSAYITLMDKIDAIEGMMK